MRPPLSAHDRYAVLVVGRRVAAELAAVALDPASGLSTPVRAAVAALVLAVDLEAHRRAGVELMTFEAHAQFVMSLQHSEACARLKRFSASSDRDRTRPQSNLSPPVNSDPERGRVESLRWVQASHTIEG